MKVENPETHTARKYAFVLRHFQDSRLRIRDACPAKVSDNICVKRKRLTKFLPFFGERNVSREYCRSCGHHYVTLPRSRGDCAKRTDTRCQLLENLRAFTPVFPDHSWITFSTSAPFAIIQSPTRSGRVHDRPRVIRKRRVSREERQY